MVGAGQLLPLSADAKATARAVFDATDRFHNPAHAADWSSPAAEDAFTAVVSLVQRALRA
ncbi:hypothetical protein [Streptomyces narbonensis]